MMESKAFEQFVMPNVNADELDSYDQFAANPAVKRIMNAILGLGKSNYTEKVKLVSLLTSYPKSWVMKLIPGVGSTTLQDAVVAADSADRGINFIVGDPITRNCHYGPKEDYLMAWLQ